MKYLYSSTTFTSKTLSAFALAIITLMAFAPNRAAAQCTPQTLPYFQTFDAAGLPACWAQEATDDDFDWLSNTGATPTANTGPETDVFNYGNYMYVNAAANNPGEIASLISPEIAVGTGATATFRYHMWGVQMGKLDFEVESPAGSGNWVNIWAQQGNKGQQWQSASVSLAAFAGQTVRFQFVAELGSGNESDIAIDLFQVRTTNCPVPTFATLSNINISSVTVGFNTGGGSSFIVEYGPAGFTPGTGTSVNNSSGTVNITGLAAATAYDVYVKASCATATPNAGPYNFTTLDCDLPTNLTTTNNTTGTSATLNWTVLVAPSVDIAVYEAAQYPGTPFLTVTGTGGTANITGLTPNTDYVWEVRGNCTSIGGNPSSYVGPAAFSTPCAPGTSLATLIIRQNGNSWPDEVFWALVDNLGNQIDSVPAGTYSGQSNGVFTYQYCLTDGASYTFRAYDAYGDGWNNATYELVCANGAVIVGPIMPSNGTSGSNDLEQSTTFTYTCPTCLPPSNFVFVSSTNNTASFTYTPGNNVNHQIQYGPPGFTPGTGTTVSVSSSPVQLTGLSAATNYSAYVRTNCGGGDFSTWVGPINFGTQAPPLVPPYTQDFSAIALPAGWSLSGSAQNWQFTTPGSSCPSRAFISNSGGGYAILDSDCYGSGNTQNSQMVTGKFDFSNAPSAIVGFTHLYRNLGGPHTFQYSIDDGASWTTVLTLPSANVGNPTSGESVDASFDLSTQLVGQSNVRFRWTYIGSYSWYWIIDDFFISVPTCFEPTNLASNTVLASSATVTWSEPSLIPGLGYEYELRTSGAAGSGATGLVDNGSLLVGTTSKDFIGLSPSTAHTFYIRSVCATGDTSSWTSTGFTTANPPPCSSLPCDFQIGTGTATQGIFPINSCYGYNYSQQIYLQPEIGIQGSIMKIRFFYNASGTSYANYNQWDIYLGHSNKASFTSTTDWVPNSDLMLVYSGPVNISASTAGTWIEIELSTPFIYNGVDNLVVAVDENIPGFSCTATWRSFNAGTNRGIMYRADGVNPDPNSPPTSTIAPSANIAQMQVLIDVLPSCIYPSALSATNVTENSVDLSWISGGTGSSWYVEAFPNDASFPTIAISTSQTSISLTGLADNMGYTINVREICPSDTSSPASAVIQTLCAPLSVPYWEDFNDISIASSSGIVECWSRNNTVGTAYIQRSTTAANSASNFGYLYMSGTTSSPNLMHITPRLTGLDMGDKMVQFNARSSVAAPSATLIIGTMSDPNDPSTFVAVQSLSGLTNYHIPYTIVLDNVPSGHQYVAIRHSANASNIFYIDDFYYDVYVPNTCDAPDGLVAEAGIPGVVNLDWNSVAASGGTYDLYYDTIPPAAGGLIITGIMSGPLSGQVPKMVELYALTDIPSLGEYGIYGNFNTTTTVPAATAIQYLPNISLSAGEYFYITYHTSSTADNTNFNQFFGFEPDMVHSTQMNFNGDDVFTLYRNGAPYDRFGNIGEVPGTSQPANCAVIDWCYWQGWGYRNSNSEPNLGNFSSTEWTFGSVSDVTTGTNATSAQPMPVGTFVGGPPATLPGTIVSGISGNSTTLTGLMPATTYYFSVRENCASTNTSAWSSVASATTACSVVNAPFTENFDSAQWVASGANSQIDPCWTREPGTGSVFAWQVDQGPTPTTASSGPSADATSGTPTGKYVFTEATNGTTGAVAELFTPYINLSTVINPVLEFAYHMRGIHVTTLSVAVVRTNGQVINVWSLSGQQQTLAADPWDTATVNLSAYNNEVVRIRFIHTKGGGVSGDVAIDNVSIKAGPPCFTPQNLAVSNVYDVTATASWITGNSNNWDLSLGAPGFNPDSGTVINTSSNPYNFTTLTPNTAYELYVRDNCGAIDGNSAWFGPVAFSTQVCPPTSITSYPYSEDMDTTTATQVPCGWDFVDGNNDGIEWEVLKRKSLASSNDRSVRIEFNSAAAMNDWLFTPEMTMIAYKQYDVKFKYRTRSEFFVEELDLTFGNAKTPAAQNEILWMGNNLTNNYYDSVEVTFRPTAAGTYYVGFHGISNANQFALYIDDFEIRETDCPSPYLVTIGTLTYTTAQVSWSGFGSSYIVEYGPTGFTPGTGTTVAVNGTSTVLTGLNVGFNYQVYVYQDCQASAKGVSLAEGPTAFATRCPDLNVTYPQLCIDNGPFTLYGGTPAGGTYSGPGVSGGVFNPAVAGAGTHTITYTIAGTNACPVPTTTTIKVNPLPNPTLVPFGNVCIGVTPYTITNGNPQGGVYSGPGVVGGTVFNPVLAGLGSHTLVYTYTDANGCVRSISGPINVTPLPVTTLAVQAPVCGTTGAPIPLTGGLPAGGTYSGPGVINNMFHPDIAGVGIHQITYTYSLGPGCSTSATRNKQVYSVPAPNAGPDQTILYGTNTQLLTTTTGGSGLYSFSWSPADSLINPNVQSPFTKNLSVINTYVVQVTDLQSGCVGYDTVVVNITGGPLFLQNSGDVTICQGESATLYALPSGGTENYQYFWTPSTYLSNPYDSLVIATPPVTTTYQILLFDGFNYRSNYVTVHVLPVPSVGLNNFASLCADASAFTLTGGQPAGGTYSGVGVSGGMFDPTVAGVGTHTITYTYTNAQGCSNSASKTITIHPMPSVEMANFNDVCIDNGPIALSNGTPFGGSYSGSGVSNGVFYPAVAGVGMHTITYSYVNPNGCGGTASKTIEVYDLPTVSMTSLGSVCVDASPVVLSTGTPTGGTYSGNGVSNGEFIPALAGVGIHTITYSYADANGCARSATGTVTVTPIPSVNLGNFASVCVNSSSMMLSGGNPAGGTYSGPGVSAGMFNPTAAGVGTHNIMYTYTDAQGCSNSATKTITVLALPTITFGSIANVCEGSSEFTLGTAFPLGGSYSGTGVSNGKFNPVTAGVGTHTITYTYTNASGCTNTATQTVTVNALPTVTFAVLSAVCESAAPFALTGGNPTGGNYTGPGVSAGIFHPSQAGPGTHTITYTYTDVNGCSNSATRTITVNGLPVVNVAPVPNQCSNGANVTLNFGTPAGGTYSGPGVTGTTFSPAAAGLGNHILTYSVTNANGCSSSTTFTIVVNSAPTVTFGPVAPLCIDGSPIQLLTGQPGGGSYSGTGVSGGMFNPQTAGVGVHTITYTFSNAAGCTGTATQTLTVEALPTVNLNNYADVCQDAPAFTLSGGTPAGGVYSGPGVFNGMFYPSIVSAGTYNVVYTYTSAAGCVNTDAGSITVNALPAQPYITQVSTILTANSSVPGVSYQWLDANQNPIPGATAQTYTVTGNGVFYVQITDANGCSSVSNRFLVDFTGIEEDLANGLNVEIYPNPNNGVFTLDILGAYGQEIGVTITDAVGKVVQKFDIPVDNMDKLSRTIDLSGYSKGVYLISVNTDNRMINKKVVVQ